jgi:hypothetical protein
MKSPDKKEALKIIQTRLNEGKPRKEILEELSNMYEDKSSIAKLIAMTPNSKTKEKYKLLNYILLCFIVLLIIPWYVREMILFFTKQPIEGIAVGFILLLFCIYCIFRVSKFKGYIYCFLAYLVFLGLGYFLINIIFKSGILAAIDIWDVYFISISLALGGVAFYLNKKMFPNYGFPGLKRDKNGDYLLE